MASVSPENEPSLNIREQLIRIDKMQAEIQKVSAEIAQIKINTKFEPWRIFLAALASAVALIGAIAAFLKLIG